MFAANQEFKEIIMSTEDIRKIINLMESVSTKPLVESDEIDEAFIQMVNNKVKHLLESAYEAAPKLTKDSPPEAKFHRGMREWHKTKASEARANGDKKLAQMHKDMVQHHHDVYRKANEA
jgi:CMP-N-acetylneuraminic acid synthetase